MSENPYQAPVDACDQQSLDARDAETLKRLSIAIALASLVFMIACTGIYLLALPAAK